MLRGLTRADLRAVMALQDLAYPDVGHDSEAMFADKLGKYPAGCLGAFEDGQLAGYLFSHPYTLGAATTLNAPLQLPETPDCYYLHDLAVGRPGRGLARQLVEAGLRVAPELTTQALVAVHRTQDFWGRFGFRVRHVPELAAKLREYSEDATYMVREAR